MNNSLSRVPPAPASGSVFILALWTLFFLGALGLAIGSLVSANINQAAQLRTRRMARQLARAGVERAVHEVVEHATNWNDKVWSKVEKNEADPPSDETLFKNNDSLEGGVFSVVYTYTPPRGQVVTNYGVLCESRKISINRSNSGQLRDALAARAGLSEAWAERLAGAIVACRKEPNGGLTGTTGSNYAAGSGDKYRCHGGEFRVLHELLLMDEFGNDPALFRQLAPHLTVHDKESFSGTATGTATVAGRFGWRAEQTVLAESRIDFVVNASGKIQYWHEY